MKYPKWKDRLYFALYIIKNPKQHHLSWYEYKAALQYAHGTEMHLPIEDRFRNFDK